MILLKNGIETDYGETLNAFVTIDILIHFYYKLLVFVFYNTKKFFDYLIIL